MSRNVVLNVLTALSLMARKATPVVTGTRDPAKVSVLSATVKGLNGFWIGTLIPLGLKGRPSLSLNGSTSSGVAAWAASKNERVYLKSANTSKYLSQISRVKEP